MTIHKEGYPTLIISLVVLTTLNFLVMRFAGMDSAFTLILRIVSVVVYVLLLNFFRSPIRSITKNDNVVLAPADGMVVVIEETTESEVLKDRRIQVSIFMSPLNVHCNRYPVSGRISYMQYHRGAFLMAWNPKSSTKNERTTVAIDSGNGIRLVVRQIAGFLARRIVCYAKENEQAKQGEELGFIKFGSRVDVFLPLHAKVKVQLNQKARGGKTVLAEL